MSFYTLQTIVNSLIDTQLNEEATKHSLVLPFISALGYNPLEHCQVQPEYYADFAQKKNCRVDYALIQENIPLVFIEVKPVSDLKLNHYYQLAKYFNATPSVKIAILTNGFIYKFFTDLVNPNLMDIHPFFQCDMRILSDYSSCVLNHFVKNNYCITKLDELIAYIQNVDLLRSLLSDLLANPNLQLIEFLFSHSIEIKRLTSKSIVQQFQDKYRKR
jgi:hypothetical protein